MKGVNCSTVTVYSSSVATCTVGSTAAGNVGTGDVYLVDSQNRDSSLPNAFTYGATWPTYTSITPTTGPSYGGFIVTVVGMS